MKWEGAPGRSAAEEAILQAERYKAQIQQPCHPGRLNQRLSPHEIDNLQYKRYLESDDDDFFHVTCHIDSNLRQKIARGEFIELEKLLQKKIQTEPQEKRLQLVNRDGESFFVPSVDKETKVDSLKKWEQAFRVYSTIYCSANPSRSGEILQYTDIIHRAAQIFSWDNVARYDYVFRQLMATKPHRSWAKTYTQMWNLTLNEPIKKFQDNNYQSHSNKNSSKRRDSVCWRYNKNSCGYGKACKFEHKCSYCGGHGHPATNCYKKNPKKPTNEGKGNGNGSGNSKHVKNPE